MERHELWRDIATQLAVALEAVLDSPAWEFDEQKVDEAEVALRSRLRLLHYEQTGESP